MHFTRFRCLTAATAVLGCALSAAAATYTIHGHVLDSSAHNAPLSYATVAIEPGGKAVYTDEEGAFSFPVTDEGTYTLRATMVGYSTAQKKVVITATKPKVIDVELVLREETQQMEELVVSANRNAVRRQEAPVVVNVLNAKLFEAVNSADLAQTLNYQSGLRVEQNCQNCGFPQVRINGLEGPYSQVLINSRPVVSSLGGVYALEQMPVNMIDRIEVVRGGGSALFGANAVGGTINVITRDPVNSGFEVGTTVSNFDGSGSWEEVFTANANVVAPSGKYGVALYETYRHRDPYDRDGDSFSETGKLRLNTLGVNTYYRLSDTQRLTVEYHNTNEFRRGGNKFELEPFRTDITEQTRHDINSGGVNYIQNWRDFTRRLNAYASAQYIDRSSYYGAQMNPDAYGTTTDATWVAGATFSADFTKMFLAPGTFTSGVEYQGNRLHDVMTGYGRDMKQNVDIWGAFVQGEWNWKHWTFLGGVRGDIHNLIDNPIFSPRLNLLYKPVPALQGRLTWSTGFRAPQAYDEDLHVTAVGGEAMLISLVDGLKPERSNSFSGSVDYDLNLPCGIDVDLLAEGFYTTLKNVFVLETTGMDDEGVIHKVRRNGNGAKVYGMNLDQKPPTDLTAFRAASHCRGAFMISPKCGARIPMWPPHARCHAHRGSMAISL